MAAGIERNSNEPRTLSKSLLTGLHFPLGFMEEARQFIWKAAPNAYCIVAIDIVYFRMFN